MLGFSGISNIEKAAAIANGYTNMPQLVAAMVKLPAIKAIKSAAKET